MRVEDRQKTERPEDGYDLAGSENMFLDRKPNENEREEQQNKKVAVYLQTLGMLQEAAKLKKEFYSDLDNAIKLSTIQH